jgi:hypothetical protein
MTAAAQNQAILKGSVQAEMGETIDLYTLMLLAPADSSIVAMEIFFDTEFQFKNIRPQTYILRLRDVQYQQYDTLITLAGGTNVLQMPIVLKPPMLSEITVRASRPVVVHNNGNFTLDVGNSYLKNEIRMEHILQKVPGILIDNGAISMFGKDNLLIYINNSEARSQEQIKSLQPADISRIEVVRNVGAQYGADVDAVLKIWTKKDREENIFISLNNYMEINHYITDEVNLSLYLRQSNKITHYLTFYSNPLSEDRQHDKAYTYTLLGNDVNLNSRDILVHDQNRRNNLFYSLTYPTGNDGELGVQYSGNLSTWSMNNQGIQQIYKNNVLNKTMNLNTKEARRRNLHTMNFNFRQPIGTNSEFSLMADYALQNMKTDNSVSESPPDNSYVNESYNISTGNYKVISVSPQYKTSVQKFRYNWGAKYSSVSGNSSIGYGPSMTEENHGLSEYTTGAYMNAETELLPVVLSAGIRMEYTNSSIRSAREENSLERKYLNFFPNITATYSPNRNLKLSAYYTKRIIRPTFSQLNPEYVYRDSLTHVTGNPNLKPIISNNFNLNVDFFRFNLTAGYRIYKDYITFDDIPHPSHPDITINTYGNMKDPYRLLIMGLSYTFNHPVFNSMTSINLNIPHMEMSFNDEIIKFRKPLITFQTSGNMNILKNTTLNCFFLYRSSGDSRNLRYKSYSNLTASVTQYLMNRKLMIVLSVEDLFQQRKSNRFTSYSSNVSYEMDSDPMDMRAAGLTIRYNWGVSNRIQKKTSDTDNINRLP